MSCPCAASYNPARKEHYVWLAFLQYDNDDAEYSGAVNCWASFMNRATCFFDWSTIFHCQVFFWNHLQRDFVSFSIDAGRDSVFLASRKQFRRGWIFRRLVVTAEQEIVMYDFFVNELARQAPFDTVGSYAVLFIPIDTGTNAWFCSKLVTAALQRAGFLPCVRPYATSPAALYRMVCRYLAGEDTSNPTRD